MSPTSLTIQKRKLKALRGMGSLILMVQLLERKGGKPRREERNFLKLRTPGSPIQSLLHYEGEMCTDFSISSGNTISTTGGAQSI